jgi:dipeptidyl aminopeptidase/acylaminoacyl peptidase
MRKKDIVPYGSWRSPITSDLIVAKTLGLAEPRLLGTDDIYWIESRPTEQGRCVLLRTSADGSLHEVTPAPYCVRSRVHEYGGGAYLATANAVYFVNLCDQQIHVVEGTKPPRVLTQAPQQRFADFAIDPGQRRLLAVCEDHGTPDQEPNNTLVSIDLASGTVSPLVTGADFFAAPRLSPDGRQLAWISWNHPNLPWDGTELWLAELDCTTWTLGERQRIAGGIDEAIIQPQWSPDGQLYFLSDRSGWWNLYCWSAGSIRAIAPMPAEFGAPPWVFGETHYAFLSPQQVVCACKVKGCSQLVLIDTETGASEILAVPYQSISSLQADADRAVFLAGSATEFPALVQYEFTTGRCTSLKSTTDLKLDPATIASPQTIEFPTTDQQSAFAFYYPPTNADTTGPAQELPPLLVLSHGGPTSATECVLKLAIQYWTSRGFAVLDVNYRGSSGYGRAYRNSLLGRWGKVDVEDCVNGALHLVRVGLVDGNRLAIRGGSAGGYTTLCALTFHSVFKAGASHYGVSDLEALAHDTHKFEARYLDRLVGPYPEQQALYRERSPIHAVDRLACPIIFFQGLDDRVVPPNQAESMVAALRAKKLPVAYLAFAGEQHGFRNAATIKRVLDAELYFYARVFKFALADAIEPVEIDNLPMA